jgi:hypothetical protein
VIQSWINTIVNAADQCVCKISFEECEFLEDATSCSCQCGLKECHMLGRNAATEFFKNCSSLKQRLSTIAKTRIDASARFSSHSVRFDNRDTTIAVAFSLMAPGEAPQRESPSLWYRALPFRFLHEYSAHIFAIDPDYEMFNDGWMVYAASDFIRRHFSGDDGEVFSHDQANVFDRKIMQSFKNYPRKGIELAIAFRLLLEQSPDPATRSDASKIFQDFTHALCSMEGDTREARLRRIRRTKNIILNLRAIIEKTDSRPRLLNAAEKGADYLMTFLEAEGPFGSVAI